MSRVQKSVKVDDSVGEGIEWLLGEELEDERMVEVVAELENEDFEPLEPFKEDNDMISKLGYNRRKPDIYGSIGGMTGFFPGMVAAAGVDQGTVFVDPHVKVSVYGMFIGGLIGAYVGSKIGRKVGEKVNEINLDEKNFEEAELGPDFNQEIYEFIAGSDFVESVEASKEVGSYGEERPDSADAAKAYRDLLEELQEERNLWEDQLFLEDYEKLSEEAQAIVDTYNKEELNKSPLTEKLKEQAEISKAHQKMIEKHEEALKETEITTFLKYDNFIRHIQSENTQNFIYEATAYEIEIYQGEDQVLTIDGVNSEKPITQLTI